MPMTSKLYRGVQSDAAAFAAAAMDRTWTAAERAALRSLADRDTVPVIRGRRRSFYLAGRYVFVIERGRPGFTVTRVPSS